MRAPAGAADGCAMLTRFRACATGGITAREATRREEAVRAAFAGSAAATPLAPPPPQFERRIVNPTAAAAAPEAENEAAAAPREETPAPRCPPAPDKPVVTIEISGPTGAGKSVIAHLIRAALAHEGFIASGPEGLRPSRWRRALDRLAWRGLAVVIVEHEAGDAAP